MTAEGLRNWRQEEALMLRRGPRVHVDSDSQKRPSKLAWHWLFPRSTLALIGVGSGSDASCQIRPWSPDGAIQPSRQCFDWALNGMANLALVDIS